MQPTPRIVKTLPELIASAPQPDSTKKPDIMRLSLFLLRMAIEGVFKDGNASPSKEWKGDFETASKETRYDPTLAAIQLHSMKQLVSSYQNRMSIAAIVKFFSDEASKCYRINSEFFNDFANIKLDRLSFYHLPTAFSGHIDLPEYLTDLEGNRFNSFFVAVDRLSKLESLIDGVPGIGRGAFDKYPHDDLAVLFSYMDRSTGVMGYLIRPFPKDRSMLISESLVGSRIVSSMESDELGFAVEREVGEIAGYPDYQRFLFNILVYLHSGQPDIRTVKQIPKLRGGAGSKVANKDRDLSLHEILLVNYSWKKQPLYMTGKWDVRMHERELRGREGESPRLVFVKAHVRERKKGMAMESTESVGADIGGVYL